MMLRPKRNSIKPVSGLYCSYRCKDGMDGIMTYKPRHSHTRDEERRKVPSLVYLFGLGLSFKLWNIGISKCFLPDQ